jgi:hypothetical protein
VRLTPGPEAGRGITLDYYGTHVYWGVELLIAAGIAFLCLRRAATEPA